MDFRKRYEQTATLWHIDFYCLTATPSSAMTWYRSRGDGKPATAQRFPEPVAKRDCGALGGKLPTRLTGSRDRSERAASENGSGLSTSAITLRTARIWGSRRTYQWVARLAPAHGVLARFSRFLVSVACIIATQWLRRRVVLLLRPASLCV